MSDHSHHHHHHHLPHGAELSAKRRKALLWAFWINAAFLVIEVIGGLVSGSLALLADAGHMLSDVASLGVALWVAHVMTRPPSKKRTYGYGRAEVLSGLLNGLVLWAVVGIILYEAVQRIWTPQDVNVSVMLPVAIAGLLANVGSAWVLMAHRDSDLNIKGAFLHLAADAVGSVGAILAALAILLGGWRFADPLASLLIGLLILWSSWGLVKDSLHILLEGTPPGLDLQAVRKDLDAIEEVESCHDLHAWLVGSGEPIMTAHLVLNSGCNAEIALDKATALMEEKYSIKHSTFQIEGAPCPELHA